MVGEQAVVIGNPFGFGLTLGAGIITGLGRSTKTDFTLLADAIQTNAGINPGVSGGPLLNRFGEVIGVATSRKDEADGIGFAIPIDRVRSAFAQMLAPEKCLGFRLGMTVAGRQRAEVTAVAAGSPAAEAGVKVGDVVRRVGSFDVGGGIDFHLALVGRRDGQKLALRLLRDGKDVAATVTLAKTKSAKPQAAQGAKPSKEQEKGDDS
jgi:serine protease Do